jgi:ABC-2 type transport system ATP-binding protein
MRVAEQLSYTRPAARARRQTRAATIRWLGGSGWPTGEVKVEDLSRQPAAPSQRRRSSDPELLVLDEPFSGLDPLGTATMTEILRERVASGVGVVFSSHQLDLVEDVCEDVVIIARGRIVAQGTIDELRAASGRRHLEVEVAGSDGGWLDGHDGGDGLRVLEHDGDRVKLLVEETVDLDGLLAAQRSAGVVGASATEPPHLSGAVHGGGGDSTGPGPGAGPGPSTEVVR